MANEPITTLVGNLTADPELRFTPSGAAVANFTVAQTPRTKQGDDWVDGEAMFVSCSVWRDYAEHVVESLQKGQRVVVLGRLKVRKWTPRDGGDERLSIEMDVDEIGPALRFSTAKVSRSGQGGGQGGGQRPAGGQGRSGGGQRRPAPPEDPWGTPTDEPPF